MRRVWLLAAGVTTLAAGTAQAKPAYQKALADAYGPLLPAKLAGCDTCHAPADSREPKFNLALGKPHNAFGARLMAVGAELAKAGKRNGIPERLDAIAKEDSDGDGVPNATELLTGHAPGAKGDRPSPAELKAAPALLAKLAARRSAYPWRPFEAVRRPPVPALRDAWVRNPVDAFVLDGLRKQGLKPRPEAPREVLLRRVCLDLTGIPPTREELAAYLADRSPDAYEKAVDRLLASPRYGERWARHWMDVWRYSDWDGYGAEVRNSQPHIWRWRDWIVESLNADKGYDQMAREMLAGDEIAPEDPKTLAATGFLVRNWYLFNRQETLNKIVEGTCKAFLGVTVNCARCHDHKYDPFSQQDYYNFQAFFQPYDVRLDRVPGELDTAKNGLARVFDGKPADPTFLLVKGDEKRPDKDRPCAAALIPALAPGSGAAPPQIQPVKLPVPAYIPEKAAHVIADQRRQAVERVAAARQALAKLSEKSPEADRAIAALAVKAAEKGRDALEAVLATEQLEDAGANAPANPRYAEWQLAAAAATAAQRLQAVAEAEAEQAAAAKASAAAEAHQPPKPDALAKAREALKKADEKLAAKRAEAAKPASTEYAKRITATYPATSTGRRTALANWIAARENPLFARVAVNHIWLRHFGKPLVPTVFDFGANGQPPANPALVDWLAAAFAAPAAGMSDKSDKMPGRYVGMGFSMKALHRLLVTSSAYRMDSGFDPASAAKDPENRWLWRFNARRLEAEAVRDSLLAVAGSLDESMGGPDLDQNSGLTVPRRSLYFRHSMEKQVEFLATFDQVPPSECYQRSESIVPQQALALANSSLAVAQSRVLAKKLWALVQSRPAAEAERDFLTCAFQQVLGRFPGADERRECAAFLASQSARLAAKEKLTPFTGGPSSPVAAAADPAARAREDLVLVLLNHNDFVTIR